MRPSCTAFKRSCINNYGSCFGRLWQSFGRRCPSTLTIWFMKRIAFKHIVRLYCIVFMIMKAEKWLCIHFVVSLLKRAKNDQSIDSSFIAMIATDKYSYSNSVELLSLLFPNSILLNGSSNSYSATRKHSGSNVKKKQQETRGKEQELNIIYIIWASCKYYQWRNVGDSKSVPTPLWVYKRFWSVKRALK